MVSSVLAQAILNQDAPDIVGAFREGQETVRQEKVKELAGRALSGGGIDPLLAELNPEVALAVGEQIRARNAQDISDFIRDAGIAKAKLDAGDVQGTLQFAQQRRNAIALRGGDTTQTDNFIRTLSQDPERARQELAALTGSLEQSRDPAGLREFTALTETLSPEEVERARRIRLGLEARETISPAELAERERQKLLVQREIKPDIKGREQAAKGISERKQGFITSGVDAADSVGNLRRSIELLETVETGGFSQAALRAKQLFGVEGADEGELSANLGRSVLSQLKPIFGAAFTAAEGERLERISEGFGRSTETNLRLLNNALRTARRAAKRGIAAAESEGDIFSANQIREALDAAEKVEEVVQQADQPRIRAIRIRAQ